MSKRIPRIAGKVLPDLVLPLGGSKHPPVDTVHLLKALWSGRNTEHTWVNIYKLTEVGPEDAYCPSDPQLQLYVRKYILRTTRPLGVLSHYTYNKMHSPSMETNKTVQILRAAEEGGYGVVASIV